MRLSNVDHELLLWVNGTVVPFEGPTTYRSEELVSPFYSPDDGGDLQPVGVGIEGTSVKLSHLRVLRDKYYLALQGAYSQSEYERGFPLEVFHDPKLWPTTDVFLGRRSAVFQLEENQFFPMGDNSPQSADARSWNQRHYVERDLLIGKAVVIYWPHTWNRPIPFLPNFRRFGFIR